MMAWCAWEPCSEPFDWDESTGDGVFCSWECRDESRDHDEWFDFYLIRRGGV